MFKCELCMYSTDRAFNLKQHFESKKHITRAYNESQKNKCTDLNLHNVPQIIGTLPNIDNKIVDLVNQNTQKNLNFEKVPKKKGTPISDPKTETEFDDFSEDSVNKTDILLSKYSCVECNKIYSSMQHLWNHKQTKKCKQKHQELEQKNREVNLQLKVDTLEQQMKEVLGKTNNQPTYNNVNSNNKIMNIDNSINSNIENNQKTIVFNYVNNAFQHTPPIKSLEIHDIARLLTMPNTKHTTIDFIIYYYKKYNLHTFLGEIIRKEYQKEDPEEQQFWVSSVMRLTFIVRQILNKENVWLKDMDGICITRHIIDPMLKEIKKMLQKFIELLNDKEIMQNKSLDEYEKAQNDGMTSLEIIKKINENELHDPILKYIAPYFQLHGETKLLNNKVVIQEKKPTKKKQLTIKNK